ncbi:Tat pathway signal protein [Haloarcula mannanilytica]|uniref:Tat pathway signal protein n=1 Tax=Haloarcula mannanilytica TaxID=2509225 RepID=A0A4C2EEA7_9EURY|nr:Tat pathway signal protein [Haloarcula mannanilytica]GCF12816.1 Tat pathway signal protein [Haloarcula mannanilytica]
MTERGISRREFAKSAVAIGGTAALAACLDRGSGAVPEGTDDPSSLPDRQHAWNAALASDDAGNHRLSRHHVLLLLDYTGDETPTDADREQVETALRDLERAYEWSNEGLLFTLGYSPAYFDRFEADVAGVDLPEPAALAPFEDPELDTPDALLHLASDDERVVIEAEEALKGRRDTANDHEMTATFDGVLSEAERRTGFVGAGLPAEHQDADGIPDSEPVPEEAPLFMGFKSGFEGNQASEDRVTVDSGPFAGGATQHLSKIRLQLQQWYEQDSRDQRVSKMFCPAHAAEDKVEGVGENLGTDSGIDGCPEDVVDSGRREGVVGHSQKLSRAREDDSPLLLRRDFDSTDGGEASVHFLSLQQSIADFVETKQAMNGTDVAENSAVGQRVNNGILQYMTVRRRGNYLLPPRSLRALPPADPA